MKRVKVWFYKHQVFFSFFIFFLFLFYLSYIIYEKTSLTPIEAFYKDIVLTVANITTPKYKVSYEKEEKLLENEKEEELKNLRNLLELANNTSYNLEHASIINRSPIAYFDMLTIDKGKNDGIDKDMLVITEKGLVGRIKYVTKNTSVVELITTKTDSFKVSVSVINDENKYHGIITGYSIEEESILVTSIRNQSQITIGSKVITNGLGNLYPKGIEVGIVDKIEMDNIGVSKIVYIKSDVDFLNLKYVSVIKGENNAN